MARTKIYSWDANTAIDLCRYKVSPARATELFSTGKYNITKDLDGWECLQEKIPEDAVIEKRFGGFDAAWKIKSSGGYPCWQMDSGFRRFGRNDTA